ncbi:MAG: UvrD-helicase domain-containing protein [Candidatus Hatepunaea meridiana]|nr:UvrD-helicase domain-containing protein [Candidatus Hatepunaea meridiana]
MLNKNKVLTELNPPQQEAIEHTEGPLLILAGAGSGKTRVLISRAAHLIHSGKANPWQILALTFTNKAAGELKSRAFALIGDEGKNIVAGTFHSILARIMRLEGLNIDIDPHFTIVDSDDRRKLIKSIIKENNIPTGIVRPAQVDWAIGQAKNSLISSYEYAEKATRDFDKIIAEIYVEYEARLKRMKGMDFDDLLIRPLQAFKKYPEFLQRLQNRFQYVLVDEFQDTNPAQYQLVREISKEHRNICVVGDDDQAIYGFRGADVSNILDFKKDWNDAKVIRLEQNYRSCKSILDVAWSVIKRNSHRHKKKLWTSREGGAQVELIITESEEDEAQRVIGYIEKEHRLEKRPYNDIALLYRTNAQSLSLEQALRGAQIPYKIVRGLRFYERKEIKDLLAYLRILVNPSDDISMLRIINYPPRSIGVALVTEIKDKARSEGYSLNQTLIEIANDPDTAPRRKKALNKFIELIDELRKLAEQNPIPYIVNEIITRVELKERLKAEEKDDITRAESKLANLNSLQMDVERYIVLNPEGTIETFLEEVSLVTEIDKLDESEPAVNLLTLHSCKGLEFKVVFVVGMEDGLLPLEPHDDSRPDISLEEERRLFYVGVTRAMDRLFLTYALNRFRWGSQGSGKPSRFISEIPSEMLQVSDMTSSGYRKYKPKQNKDYSSNTIPSASSKKLSPKSRKRTQTKKSKSSSTLSADELQKGLLVKHPKFGLGVIVKFNRNGEDSRIDIDFDDVGNKTLILKYARLEATL